MLNRLAIRHSRPPVRFNHRLRRWSVRRFPATQAEPDTAPSTSSTPVIQDLFQAVGIHPEELTLRSKYGSNRKRKKKKRNQGLQYRIKFWKGITGKERERKFTAQTRDSDQTNDDDWSDAAIYRIAGLLVDRSFEEVFALEQKHSTRIAEIVAWVNRRFDQESPFNFEVCCSVAGYNADDLRTMFFDRLKRKHDSTYPHYSVLRNGIIDAEHGDPDALEWVLSDLDTPMSFRDCCHALGFDHSKARSALLLPIVVNDSDELYDQHDSLDIDTTSPFTADLAYA